MKQQFATMRPYEIPQMVNAMLTPPQVESREACYNIRKLSADVTEVSIYDLIGWDGITANQFVKELQAIQSKNITLRINSDGGIVSDGLAIYNAIRRHPATVNAFIDGLAASTASFIAMAGDTVTMSPHSQMMIHDAFMVAGGPADFFREQADILDKTSDNIASIYAERAGGTTEEWRALMKASTWFSDEEAVVAGLADGIDGVEDKVATFTWTFKALDTTAAMEPEKEPEPESAPEAPDFNKLFEDIVEDEEYALA